MTAWAIKKLQQCTNLQGVCAKKYHALIVADYDVDMWIFAIAVMWPGTEKFAIISVPHDYSDEEAIEEQIKEVLEQLRKEKTDGN